MYKGLTWEMWFASIGFKKHCHKKYDQRMNLLPTLCEGHFSAFTHMRWRVTVLAAQGCDKICHIFRHFRFKPQVFAGHRMFEPQGRGMQRLTRE